MVHLHTDVCASLEKAVAKLRITTLRANSTPLESVLEMRKKPAKRKNA
ncbi:Uncharacterized protein BM_BM1024 [Brugia malayi]|uniref:Bm1024 n=1 Tax=Brugia malayi TaxID=6279 RepID=A0A0K0IMK1_BRUMA|nr:Uncharacterized protein BM_BM1024 [Brugia malayi]CTP81685.1 Bm1024 [Brugia malayi]VIO96240.1 Uncharacterized protein BM_BM1024 [Brugia malayi]